jgi:hypothetical protein
MRHKYAMRTSIDLNDSLLLEAKRIAAEQHTSLKAVVEDGIRFIISSRRQTRFVTPADWPVCTQAKPVAGVDLTRTGALLELTETP